MQCDYFLKDLMKRFALEGDHIAFSLFKEKKIENISYACFVDHVLTAAGYFKENLIKKKRIAFIASNSYEWIVAFFGVLVSDNIAVLLDGALPGDILQAQSEKANVSMILCDSSRSPEFTEVFLEQEVLTFDCLLRESKNFLLEEVCCAEPDKPLFLLETSGTTGKNKIVEVTTKNISSFMKCTVEAFKGEGLERTILVLPLHHISGVADVITRLYWGKTLCIGRGVKYLFSDMAILHPTDISLVPSMMESLEKILKAVPDLEKRKKYIGNQLYRLHVAGASSKKSTCRFLMCQGFFLDTAYGLTETTGVGTWCMLDEEHIGTIGKALPQMEYRFLDGELLLKGPAVIQGYYRDPEESKKVFEDGWFHTGDLVSVDEDGYFYLTGRKKNVIILPNGENVNPEEIEKLFYQCPSVLECMVYSDGKGICADLYTHDEKEASDCIKNYNETMPLYRKVYKVNYQDIPLEKTGSGKIKRKG